MLKQKKFIIGIDEVGRGPLAGPVVVSAVAVPTNFRFKSVQNIPLRDSKKLSPRQREIWFQHIQEHFLLIFQTSAIVPKTIDRINITQAANLAASRALSKIYKIIKSKTVKTVFLDGGLNVSKSLKTRTNELEIIIKGDEKIPVVSLASIIAKVCRDKYMIKQAKKYPEYGFEKHKGYGTKEHFRALKQHGFCPIHRLTFIKKYIKIKSK